MALPLMGIIGGATQIIGSAIGGGARRREQREAQREFSAAKQAFQDFSLQNKFANLENTAEDLKVSTTAFDARQQARQAGAAQSLDAMVAAGLTGTGAAQSTLASLEQGLMADSQQIAQQELTNQRAAAQQAATNQFRTATAADDLQLRQYDRSQQLLNMSSSRKNAADQARAQATAQLVGGIGSFAGGVGTAMAGAKAAGGFGKALLTNTGGVPQESGLSMAELKAFLGSRV